MEREHKGWQIEVNSYRSEGDKWRPNIRFWTRIAGSAREENLVVPAHRLFDTERESDEYGCQQASDWIDMNG
jgi:hypothetical protein